MLTVWRNGWKIVPNVLAVRICCRLWIVTEVVNNLIFTFLLIFYIYWGKLMKYKVNLNQVIILDHHTDPYLRFFSFLLPKWFCMRILLFRVKDSLK